MDKSLASILSKIMISGKIRVLLKVLNDLVMDYF